MIRALLVLPERDAGWRREGIVPLLDEAESGTHAALCAAGVSVEMVSARVPSFDGVAREPDLVVMVRPTEHAFRQAEASLASTSVSLLRIQDRARDGEARGPRLNRRILLKTPGPPVEVSRLPLRSRVRSWRRRASFPSLVVLRPSAEEDAMGSWAGGGPCLLRRACGPLRIWTLGFPLDHLGTGDLRRLVGCLAEKAPSGDAPRSPIPPGVRAVVIILHDVEEPLPDDPRGVRSVREGLEACLESEGRRGLRATYNLVGAFAGQIENLVRRIAAEGHELASHGETHHEIVTLEPAALRQEVRGAEERIVEASGSSIKGFRSPRSRWSGPLLDLLAERGYRWNAEADDSPYPYQVPRGGRRDFVRIPVAVDDWDYVRRRAEPRRVLDLWKREVLSAEERGCWVGIGSHPSVLGVRPERMRAFDEFLEWLSGRAVRVMTLGQAAGWWLERLSGHPTRSGGEPA